MSQNENDQKRESPKKPTSQRKIDANRANSKHSTGPKTEAGKAKSAENSYKHGFFAARLYPNKELRDGDLDHFNAIRNALHSHYAPSGDLECFWLDKMATDLLRTARALGYEQTVLRKFSAPFEIRSMDRLMRYESTLNRSFAYDKKMLEELQAERKAHESAQAIGADAGDVDTTPESNPCEPSLSSRENEALEAAPTAASEDPAEPAQPEPAITLDDDQLATSTQSGAVSETEGSRNRGWIETSEDRKFIDEIQQGVYDNWEE